MKRFLQYLSEDFPAFEAETMGGSISSRAPEEPMKHLGTIGPYKIVHHSHDHQDYTGGVVSVLHKGKQVGEFPLVKKGKYLNVSAPMLVRTHRGKNALVKNLGSKVYGMIADKIGSIESETTHTIGGRYLWRKLAKLRPVTVANETGLIAPNTVHVYTHPNHPNLKMPSEHFDTYADNHQTIHDSDMTKYVKLSEIKKDLSGLGMDKKAVSAIKTKDDLPHPRQFKKTVVNLKKIGRYDPDKHDTFVYGQPYEEGRNKDIVLRLHGNK
jgi:hypothetical protein